MTIAAQDLAMLRAPVISTFFRYSIPWALAMLMTSSAGIVDGFFVGRHVGTMALAALNIIAPAFPVFMGLAVVLASGGAVRCAHYRGAGREAEASAIFTKTLVAVLGASIALSALGTVFAEQVVRWMGARDALVSPSLEYLRILLPFCPVVVLGLALSYFVRVEERPGLASGGLICSAIINIVLDWLFITQWGWGIQGAAWATGIGYVGTLALMSSHFISSRCRLKFTSRYGAWSEVLLAAWNGISEMISELSVGTVVLLTNWVMIQRVGPDGVAAFTVINYSLWFCLMLSYGISDSLGPLVSANHGARNYGRVQAFLRVGLGSVWLLGLATFTLLSVFPQQMVSVFLPQGGRATTLALEFMAVARFALLADGINIVFTAYFTGLLQATASAMVAILRGLLLPVLFLLTLPRFLGDWGIFVALPLAEGVTLGVALLLYKRIQRRMLEEK